MVAVTGLSRPVELNGVSLGDELCDCVKSIRSFLDLRTSFRNLSSRRFVNVARVDLTFVVGPHPVYSLH